MAFAIGSITYTIYKLVSSLNETFADSKLQPVNRIDANAGLIENLSASSARVKYDEVEITEIFENLVNETEDYPEPDKFEKSEKKPKEKDEREPENSQQTERQTLEDIYEEITITEYLLNYNHDYGDLQNLRMRNDFVFNAAEIREIAHQNQRNLQKEKSRETDDKRSEQTQNDIKKAEELKLQQKSAEQFTKRISRDY